MDTGKRTILKAILWNVLGLAMMSLVGFLMTGSVMLGGTLAFANTGVGLLSYILYERIWSRIAWGRVEHRVEHRFGHRAGARHV